MNECWRSLTLFFFFLYFAGYAFGTENKCRLVANQKTGWERGVCASQLRERSGAEGYTEGRPPPNQSTRKGHRQEDSYEERSGPEKEGESQQAKESPLRWFTLSQKK